MINARYVDVMPESEKCQFLLFSRCIHLRSQEKAGMLRRVPWKLKEIVFTQIFDLFPCLSFVLAESIQQIIFFQITCKH